MVLDGCRPSNLIDFLDSLYSWFLMGDNWVGRLYAETVHISWFTAYKFGVVENCSLSLSPWVGSVILMNSEMVKEKSGPLYYQ